MTPNPDSASSPTVPSIDQGSLGRNSSSPPVGGDSDGVMWLTRLGERRRVDDVPALPFRTGCCTLIDAIFVEHLIRDAYVVERPVLADPARQLLATRVGRSPGASSGSREYSAGYGAKDRAGAPDTFDLSVYADLACRRPSTSSIAGDVSV